MNRIAWLDSCRMPSHIHSTLDGEHTVCGHAFLKMFDENNLEHLGGKRWIKSNDVPRKDHGTSRYCKTCFKDLKKNLEWL